MRRLAALAALAAVLAGTGAAVLRRADAQETPRATVLVSGATIGKGARAVVRFVNTSAAETDKYRLRYTVQALGAGEPLSLPGAGPDGVIVGGGDDLAIDLGEVVNRYRASLGIGPYQGQVRLVAFGERAYLQVEGPEFGPTTVHVSAVQTEGAARYEPLVEWR